jgi:hypothetical protein
MLMSGFEFPSDSKFAMWQNSLCQIEEAVRITWDEFSAAGQSIVISGTTRFGNDDANQVFRLQVPKR